MALNPLVVGGGGVRSTQVTNQNVCGRSPTVGSQDSIFLFLKSLSKNQPSGCNDGSLMAFQFIEGALCC